MGSQYFSVKGFEEFEKALTEIDQKVGKTLLKDCIKTAMKPMLAAARGAAPVESGAMKRNIKLRAMKKSRKGFGFTVGIGEKDFQGKEFYGSFQEFGTSKMEPKGFLRKAFDENKDNAIQTFTALLKAGLKV